MPVRIRFERRGLRRVLLWSLPLVAVVLWGLASLRLERRARSARALDSLLADDLDRAESRFDSLGDETGVAVVEAAKGRRARETIRRRNLSRFPLEALMGNALRARRYAGVRALADLTSSGSPLFVAASLVENRRESEARAVLNASPGLFRSTEIGRRIEQALTLERSFTIVRDRRGELVGTLDERGRLQIETAEVADLLPPAAAPRLDWRPAGLRSSIDLEWSRMALSALGPYRGSIVILDARRGEVIVAVSDARTRRDGGTPAFEQEREPASIAKLITTTAALRAGIDPDGEISRMTCTGSERYEGGPLYCSYRAGPLRGLDEALAVSCNIAFANLGALVGRDRLLAEYRRFGFERSGARIIKPIGNGRQLADLAIGLEPTTITPLRAALLAATFANDGVMPSPALVAATDGRLGLSPRAVKRDAGRPVLEREWTLRLLRAMAAVTEAGGTAGGIAPATFPVAMKTGTAAERGAGYHVNYIGVGPLPHPEIAFCVRITHQPTSSRVNRAAYAVTGSFLAELAARPHRPL